MVLMLEISPYIRKYSKHIKKINFRHAFRNEMYKPGRMTYEQTSIFYSCKLNWKVWCVYVLLKRTFLFLKTDIQN